MKTLKEWTDGARRIVFFGGAGVSTASGIPDFRSADGLYSAAADAWTPPETVLSRSYFMAYPDAFYTFYRSKMIHLEAQPNAAHRTLARWEQEGRLTAVITQNIDGLHQAAGSKNVLELHGSIWRNHCLSCQAEHSLAEVLDDAAGAARCRVCGGLVKPDVVLYEEALDPDVMTAAVAAIRQADLLIVGGTSLAVWPAAGLIHYRRCPLILINRDPTPADDEADLLLRGNIAEILV